MGPGWAALFMLQALESPPPAATQDAAAGRGPGSRAVRQEARRVAAPQEPTSRGQEHESALRSTRAWCSASLSSAVPLPASPTAVRRIHS